MSTEQDQETPFPFKFMNLNTHHGDIWMMSCKLDSSVKGNFDNSYLKSEKIVFANSFYSSKCSNGTH